MKKILGVLLVWIWVTMIFYYSDMITPKGILHFVIVYPIIVVTSLCILKKVGFKM